MSYSLLFDIGNVIVTFDFQIAADRISTHCEIPAESILPSVADYMIDLESGAITTDEFLDRAIEKVRYSGDRVFLINSLREVFEVNEPMAELIEEESAKGTPLYLLSNTSGVHVPWLFDRYPVFRHFQRGVYSHEAKSMKPDAVIYQKAIADLGLDPARTIYIDDKTENCVAGGEHGFPGICYQVDQHGAFLDELHAIRNRITGGADS